MAKRGKSPQKARPRWWELPRGDAAKVGVAGSAVFSNAPVYALVLEEVPGEPPLAKVLFENGDYEKPNGDQIKTIRQLQNAAIDRVSGSFEAYRRDFEGDPRVFAEDPRNGGSCTDRTSSRTWLLLGDKIGEGKDIHSGYPVDSAHRTFENPYFVLVRRNLAAAAAEIAGVGEASAGPEAWDGKEGVCAAVQTRYKWDTCG